ncbi:MAG TPA: MFS transporter [Bacillota bacterium]|jgi:MFS family permease
MRPFDQSFIDEPVTRQNARASLFDGMWYAVMMGLAFPFYGVFAIKLGGNDYIVGLVTSLPALVTMLAFLPGAAYANRYVRLVDPLLISAFINRVSFLLFAIIPFLPLTGMTKAWLFVILLAVASFPGTVANVSWTALMGRLFPGPLRASVFSQRNMMGALVTLVCTLAAGVWLDAVAFPYNYVAVFVLSFATLMASMYYLGRLHEEPARSAEEQPCRPRGSGGLWREPRFVGFTVASFVFHFGWNLPAAVLTVYFVRILGLPQSWIGLFSTIAGLTSVLTYRLWGRVSDRRGNRFGLVASTLGFALVIFLYIFSPSPYYISALMLLGGVATAGFNLILFNGLLDVCPPESRATPVAVFNTVIGVANFIAPTVGIVLLDRVGLIPVFVTAAAVRVIGALIYWRRA